MLKLFEYYTITDFCRSVNEFLLTCKITLTEYSFISIGLKIPKVQSKFVYRRRTGNTMAKRKSTKKINSDQQNIHIQLQSE